MRARSVLLLPCLLGLLGGPACPAAPPPPAAVVATILPSTAIGRHADLVELRTMIPDLIEEVRYATPHNFTGKAVYPSARVFLRRRAAERLAAAARYLARHHGLRLKVFDGYRPLSVQKRFWEILPDERFVANPATGSRHNRGAAVDLTLVGPDGTDLDMGTAFDDFTERAGHGYRDLPPRVLANRRLLKSVMRAFGFQPLASEWWHYDLTGWQDFPIEDIPLPDADQVSGKP